MSVKAKNGSLSWRKGKFEEIMRNYPYVYTGNAKGNTKTGLFMKTHGEKLFKNLTF